jgi:CubicO group peptidase (beta-lactamase class C family)
VADYYDPEGQYYHESRNWVPDGVESRMVYANMGYALNGHLVEVLTGESFPTFCQDHIFGPLEMEQTSWHLAGLDESTVAMPYIWSNGDYRATGHYGYPDYPDGGLRTGAEQLARFMAMGMGGGELGLTRILDEDTFVEMMTVHYPDLDDSQGLAWYSWKLDGEALWGHDGGDIGVATEAGIRWSDELGFVFLMNGEGTRGDTFENLERALLDAGETL